MQCLVINPFRVGGTGLGSVVAALPSSLVDGLILHLTQRAVLTGIGSPSTHRCATGERPHVAAFNGLWSKHSRRCFGY